MKKVLTESILIIHRLWYNCGKINRKKRLHMENGYDIESIRGKKLDSRKEKIDKYFKEYKRMKFVYDFGDNWVHDVIVEKKINEKIENPICIKAKSGVPCQLT